MDQTVDNELNDLVEEIVRLARENADLIGGRAAADVENKVAELKADLASRIQALVEIPEDERSEYLNIARLGLKARAKKLYLSILEVDGVSRGLLLEAAKRAALDAWLGLQPQIEQMLKELLNRALEKVMQG